MIAVSKILCTTQGTTLSKILCMAQEYLQEDMLWCAHPGFWDVVLQGVWLTKKKGGP